MTLQSSKVRSASTPAMNKGKGRATAADEDAEEER